MKAYPTAAEVMARVTGEDETLWMAVERIETGTWYDWADPVTWRYGQCNLGDDGAWKQGPRGVAPVVLKFLGRSSSPARSLSSVGGSLSEAALAARCALRERATQAHLRAAAQDLVNGWAAGVEADAREEQTTLLAALAGAYPEVFDTYFLPKPGTEEPDPNLVGFLRDLVPDLANYVRLRGHLVEFVGQVAESDCPGCHAMGEQEHDDGCAWPLIIGDLAQDLDGGGEG